VLLIRFSSRTHFENSSFIDDELAIVTNGDLKTIQRPRRWTFEVQTRLEKPAAMARTFEFVLGRKPARRTAQMGTFGEDGVDTGFLSNNPDALILLELLTNFTERKIRRQSGFEG
jgi:hypothetical protein